MMIAWLLPDDCLTTAYDNWQSLTTADDHWRPLTIADNHWRLLMTTDDHWWPLTTTDNLWRLLTTANSHRHLLTNSEATADNHWQTWTCLYCSGFPTNFALILKFPKLFSFKIFPSLLAKQQNRRWHRDFSTNVIGRSYLSGRCSLKKSCW